MSIEYSSSPMPYTVWDSYYGWCCQPAYQSNTLYFDVVVTGSPNSWYCQFEPNNYTWSVYPTSYSGSYSNAYSYFSSYQSDGCELVFYWSDDNTEAASVTFTASDYNCP